MLYTYNWIYTYMLSFNFEQFGYGSLSSLLIQQVLSAVLDLISMLPLCHSSTRSAVLRAMERLNWGHCNGGLATIVV